MRLPPLGGVTLIYADQLGAEGRPLTQRPGHDAEKPAFRKRNDGAEQLLRLSARERDHGIAHDGNTDFVSKPSRDLVTIDESHQVCSFVDNGRGHILFACWNNS